MKTWHVENAVAVAVIAGATVVWGHGGVIPWLAAAAKFAAWAAMSIGNRNAERARIRAELATAAGVPDNAHEVTCARQLVWYVIAGQLLGAAASVAGRSWDGFVVGALFAGYPAWRWFWRRVHPIARG